MILENTLSSTTTNMLLIYCISFAYFNPIDILWAHFLWTKFFQPHEKTSLFDNEEFTNEFSHGKVVSFCVAIMLWYNFLLSSSLDTKIVCKVEMHLVEKWICVFLLTQKLTRCSKQVDDQHVDRHVGRRDTSADTTFGRLTANGLTKVSADVLFGLESFNLSPNYPLPKKWQTLFQSRWPQ